MGLLHIRNLPRHRSAARSHYYTPDNERLDERGIERIAGLISVRRKPLIDAYRDERAGGERKAGRYPGVADRSWIHTRLIHTRRRRWWIVKLRPLRRVCA